MTAAGQRGEGDNHFTAAAADELLQSSYQSTRGDIDQSNEKVAEVKRSKQQRSTLEAKVIQMLREQEEEQKRRAKFISDYRRHTKQSTHNSQDNYSSFLATIPEGGEGAGTKQDKHHLSMDTLQSSCADFATLSKLAPRLGVVKFSRSRHTTTNASELN